jgi:hypothetical protein
MVSYNRALDIDTAFLVGHHRRPRTALDHAQYAAKPPRRRPAATSRRTAPDLANFAILLGGNDGEHLLAPDANSPEF